MRLIDTVHCSLRQLDGRADKGLGWALPGTAQPAQST